MIMSIFTFMFMLHPCPCSMVHFLVHGPWPIFMIMVMLMFMFRKMQIYLNLYIIT